LCVGENPNIAQPFQRFSNQKTVLVVDDDDISQIVLVHQLRNLGLSARQTASGVETVSLVRENPDEFCLILMDVNIYLLPTSFQEVENTIDCSNQSKRNRKT
jgi:CheY-like chemotaxis protein